MRLVQTEVTKRKVNAVIQADKLVFTNYIVILLLHGNGISPPALHPPPLLHPYDVWVTCGTS